jgi:D-methionine transport system ATP-binding protein
MAFSVRNVSKTYDTPKGLLTALDSVSLEIADGEIFGIIGRSGAGKSTLLRCLNLLEKPTTGEIYLAGEDVTGLSASALRRARREIGVVFQHFNLLQSRTVADNIAFPLEISGASKSARAARVAELVEMVGLSGREHAYPAQLSGGQKQRVGIARALAAKPQVLLCDEPTSALDSETTSQILDLLRELNGTLGVTVVLITHDLSVVRRVCDRAALLEAGRVVDVEDVAEMASNPDSPLGSAFSAFLANLGVKAVLS